MQVRYKLAFIKDLKKLPADVREDVETLRSCGKSLILGHRK